jgi:hypothetical protein
MGLSPIPPTMRRLSLTFPVLLITVGLMFLADHLVRGWGIAKTWPVLLVVWGVLKLMEVRRPPSPPEGPRI